MKKVNNNNRYYCHRMTVGQVASRKKTVFIHHQDDMKNKYLVRLQKVYHYSIQLCI